MAAGSACGTFSSMRPHAPDHPGLNTRAKVAIGLCAVLPMVIGILITVGTFHSAPAGPTQLLGHWVYVPSSGAAVHIDGRARRVDAQVAVGSASTGSQVVADQHAAYLVDYDHVITFNPGGVTATGPAAGVAENPVPVEAAGTAYLVYRTSGLIMRLGPSPVTIGAGGPLDAPAATPGGALWVHRTDTGDLCVVGPTALNCPARAPAGHVGALAARDDGVVFVDLTADTWQPLDQHGLGQSTKLGVSLPQDAEVSTRSVAGQLAVVDPDGLRLYLLSAQGGVITVPLGSGHFGNPVSTQDAVAVVNTDTGTVVSFGATGSRRGSVPVSGGAITLAAGNDGLVYADSSDGLQTVIMAEDGTLTPIRTTDRTPPSYQPPAPVAAISLPPATVATTTTESVPPAPNTVTVGASPTSGDNPAGGGTKSAAGTDGSSGTTTKRPTATSPAPGPPPGSPVIDVLSATATGSTTATIQIHVTGDGPVFCHVFFNSVERAGTNCAATMQVTATGLPQHTLFDIYVIGTNAKGTGEPGRRAELQN
ncbi:MAG TPA: hypothetical protein VGM75_29675 [Pseudonocardiaceae bacterium]